MRTKLLSATLGLLITAGCYKPKHTSVTVHHQRYSTFNFVFNGATYNNSLSDSSNGMWSGNNISNIFLGDTSILVRELNVSFYNARYTVNFTAKKTSLGFVTGVYKIGDGMDSATHYPFTYGTASISGFTNRENYYTNVVDTSSSYVTITEYNNNEMKGTFVLKLEDYSHTSTSYVTGDFDIITP